MTKNFFKVAEHVFAVEVCDEMLSQMSNYAPFAVAPVENALFSLAVQESGAPEYTEEIRQEDEGQSIICGRTADGLSVFEFLLSRRSTGVLVCAKDFKQARLFIKEAGRAEKAEEKRRLDAFALNNALMVMFALATAEFGTALFHAAGIRYNGLGYLFLGKSGTGKNSNTDNPSAVRPHIID